MRLRYFDVIAGNGLDGGGEGEVRFLHRTVLAIQHVGDAALKIIEFNKVGE